MIEQYACKASQTSHTPRADRRTIAETFRGSAGRVVIQFSMVREEQGLNDSWLTMGLFCRVKLGFNLVFCYLFYQHNVIWSTIFKVEVNNYGMADKRAIPREVSRDLGTHRDAVLTEGNYMRNICSVYHTCYSSFSFFHPSFICPPGEGRTQPLWNNNEIDTISWRSPRASCDAAILSPSSFITYVL